MIELRTRTVADWVRGWALSRGTPAPVEEPDGYRVDVGLPAHRVRYVLPDPAAAGPRAATLTEPGTWLKVCGSPDQVQLTPAWTVGAPEYLMTIDLHPHPPVPPPATYTAELRSTGDVHDAVVLNNDHLAAKGRVAVCGSAAVVDVVETDPAHRRRGLGRVVMSELTRAAAAGGATRAVLVATEDGRALYEKLGWAVVSPVTAAHLPVP
ncbi:GNAT family N-acetyltransferase [Lentzea guizhouensis]|uniref:GNAT family N-acetyltransferase n=1 Tax=Lentzea guizhouensis TaxID=1586287 RepID=A0A1B2HNE3_9PSEU|nr:GNAT family N-acetyltransferase [Lentzea guizhouensis]ANZ39211.1 GNAT family N-acetyltransferase [Lentzea guizhouensis]